MKSVVHAFDILRAFHDAGDDLRLRDVVSRTGFRKGTCFRLLYTLHQCGVIEKDRNRYRLTRERQPRKRYRIGYVAQGQDTPFSQDVRASLLRAADRQRIELITFDDCHQPEAALRNTERLLREGVDLVIEFQTDEAIAAAIISTYLQSGIPMIAIESPHPGATYFGANNYDAGRLAGRCLGEWARCRSSHRVDEILLLGQTPSRSLQARLRGVLGGIKEVLPDAGCGTVVSLDGGDRLETSLERVRKHLRKSKAKQVLVGAANDTSALGAARAFEEAGRSDGCAIVGQNAEPDARAELREPRTPLIASIGHFPEKYGDALVRVAVDILCRRRVPPAVFVRHEVITRQNVDHYYPNDVLDVTRLKYAAE